MAENGPAGRPFAEGGSGGAEKDVSGMDLATAEQMKRLDRRAIEERGIPSLALMERAARGLAMGAIECLAEPMGAMAAVFCGPGNNGGDGLAAARMLAEQGVTVRAFLAGDREKMTPDAQEMARRMEEAGIALEPFDPENASQRDFALHAHVIVDAVLGTGLKSAVRPAAAAAIELMNTSAAPVVAADIPSGVETDTGRVMGTAVNAVRTITFTKKKRGLCLDKGAVLAGEVIVRLIGIPRDLVEQERFPVQLTDRQMVRAWLPEREPDGYKGKFGKVFILAGSVGYTGAPVLAAGAAAASGVGLVTLGVPEDIYPLITPHCTEVMPLPLPEEAGGLGGDAAETILARCAGCSAVLIGPGLGRAPDTAETVRRLLRELPGPVVLDADGINALEGHMDILRERKGRVTVLTPHDGEFARMGGTLDGGRLAAAQGFAAEYGCVLVLKGHATVTAGPDGRAYVNGTGNDGMAKGGSGDVLSGLVLSMLGQGMEPLEAAACAVWLHGRSGDLCRKAYTARGMLPSHMIAKLGEVFRDLEGRDEE